eukprot:12190254-Heterocapsa_arctica.AAC.1
MGYSWLCNYKKNLDLDEFQEIANFQENGILYIMMEDEPEQTEAEMEEAGLPNKIKVQGMMTEEMTNHIADIVSASLKT